MTNAELAILSVVAERPRHGYEIDQVITERDMREWTEVGLSSIYYVLRKLEKAGLIEGHLEEAGRGPARRVYRVTPAGAEARRVALLAALSQPQRCYPPLQLGLAGLPALGPAEAVAALEQYRTASAARLAHIQERRRQQQPRPFFVDAMFDQSASLLEAELAWVERLIARLGQEQAGA